MSGFEADWLALREPADRRARDLNLLADAASFVADRSGTITDLGCGTGSTFRALDPKVGAERSWVFVDDDPALLERAANAMPEVAKARVRFHRADLAGLDKNFFEGAALVTASALFDLVSARFIRDLVQHLKAGHAGLYAALSVDGRVEWTRAHRLDETMVQAFAHDQTRDKGFGPGLGGEAAEALERALAVEGFKVRSARSDWVLGPEDLALQDAFHSGFAEPARAFVEAEAIAEWLAFRKEAARAGTAVRVGHRDCLARPPVAGG